MPKCPKSVLKNLEEKYNELEQLTVSVASLNTAVITILKEKNIILPEELDEHVKKVYTEFMLISTDLSDQLPN